MKTSRLNIWLTCLFFCFSSTFSYQQVAYAHAASCPTELQIVDETSQESSLEQCPINPTKAKSFLNSTVSEHDEIKCLSNKRDFVNFGTGILYSYATFIAFYYLLKDDENCCLAFSICLTPIPIWMASVYTWVAR